MERQLTHAGRTGRVSRRHVLGSLAGVGTIAVAGCLDAFDDGLAFEAEQATIADATLESTGYEEHDVRSVEVERTFEAAGEEATVTVTNWHHEYDKSIDLVGGRYQAAIVGILTSPQVEALDRTFNPLGDMSPEEIAARVQDHLEGIDDLEAVDETTAPVAGRDAQITAFEGEATIVDGGVTADVRMHVSEAVASDDDFIVAMGGYPLLTAEWERDAVFTMFEAIEHPVE